MAEKRIAVDIRRLQDRVALVVFEDDGGRQRKAIVNVREIGADVCVSAEVLQVAIILPNLSDYVDPETVRRRFEAEILKLSIVQAADLLKRLPDVRGALASAYSEDLRTLIAFAKRQRRQS